MKKTILFGLMLSSSLFAAEEPRDSDKDKALKNTTNTPLPHHLRRASRFCIAKTTQIVEGKKVVSYAKMIDENKTDEIVDPFDEITLLVKLINQDEANKKALINKATYQQ